MPRRILHYAPMLPLVLAACATAQSPKGPASAPASRDTGAKPAEAVPRALAHRARAEPAWDAGLLTAVPDRAVAVLAVGPGMGLRAMHSLVESIPELKKELAAFLDRALGIDVVGKHAGSVALIATALQPQPELCLRLPLRGVKGSSLVGQAVGRHQGVDLIAVGPGLVAGLLDDALLIGVRPAVTRVIDQRRHNVRVALAARLATLAARAPTLAASIDLSAFGGPTAAFGMHHALVTVDRRFEVVLEIEGDAALLARVPPLYTMGTSALITRMLHEKTMAKRRGDVGVGAGAILAYHLAKKIISDATPQLDEKQGTLISRFQLPMMDVSGLPMIGVLAATAIPTFIKYVRRSKATEARASIKQLELGAKALASSPGGMRKLARLGSTPWTPLAGCCQQPGQRCTNASQFAHPTFRALGFSPQGSYRYQYRVVRKGRGKRLTLTIEARGDLDCDGQTSSFVLEGKLDGGALSFVPPRIVAELE